MSFCNEIGLLWAFRRTIKARRLLLYLNAQLIHSGNDDNDDDADADDDDLIIIADAAAEAWRRLM